MKQGIYAEFLTLGCALGAMLGSGCNAVSPVRQEGIVDQEVPGVWKSSAESVGGVDDNWIASFRDTTLKGLVEEAEQHNFDLKIAAARVEKARSNARIAGADLYPTITGGLNGSRRKQSFIGFPFGGGGGGDSSSGDASASTGGSATGTSAPVAGSTGSSAADAVISSLTNSFGVSLDVQWEIDVWGRVRAGLAAALAEADGAEAELASLRSSIAAQTAKAWFAAQEAEQQLQLSRDSLASFEDSVEIIRARYETGDQSAAQLRLAKSDVATAQARLTESEELKRQALRQLEVIVGRYPAAEVPANGKLPTMPKPVPAGLPSELLTRRPDLQAGERRIAAADRRILEAKLAALPQFALTASAGTSTDKLRDVLMSDYGIWSLAGNILQPIFTGGQVKGNYDLRKAELREALADFNRLAVNAFREVENGLSAESVLASRERSLIEAEGLASEAYTQSREEYRQGLADVITLLTAQRQMLLAKGQVITIRRLRLENRVDLHLALGGDFKPGNVGMDKPNTNKKA
ncbi:MAG: efflux transporter outer membrane subunit [Verrucomicrobia bacterium]|nr:efflux transporter outer membrane subunit [Verrucomicrobiota bacterium]